MIITKAISLRLLAVIFVFTSPYAFAQSMQIMGGNGYARSCFEKSEQAAILNSSAHKDIEHCSLAIQYEKLKRSNLVATYVNRGIIYSALHKDGKAERDYNKAIRLSKETGEAYANRANLWFKAGDFDRAVEDYTIALDKNLIVPHVVHLNRGMVFERLGKLQEAKIDYVQALVLRGGWMDAKIRLQRVQRKLDNKKNT